MYKFSLHSFYNFLCWYRYRFPIFIEKGFKVIFVLCLNAQCAVSWKISSLVLASAFYCLFAGIAEWCVTLKLSSQKDMALFPSRRRWRRKMQLPSWMANGWAQDRSEPTGQQGNHQQVEMMVCFIFFIVYNWHFK